MLPLHHEARNAAKSRRGFTTPKRAEVNVDGRDSWVDGRERAPQAVCHPFQGGFCYNPYRAENIPPWLRADTPSGAMSILARRCATDRNFLVILSHAAKWLYAHKENNLSYRSESGDWVGNSSGIGEGGTFGDRSCTPKGRCGSGREGVKGGWG